MQAEPMLAHVRNLLAHAEWANAILFDAWGRAPARDHEELRRRAGHMIGVAGGFLSILQNLAPGRPPDGPPQSFDELKTRAISCHTGLRDFAEALDDDSLSREVRIPWFPDPPCIVTTAEALVQVAMHTQHHRGQFMTRLKYFGGEPENVDWIIWLWIHKPQAKWN